MSERIVQSIKAAWEAIVFKAKYGDADEMVAASGTTADEAGQSAPPAPRSYENDP